MRRLLCRAAVLVLGYHALLLAAVALRFGSLPNYARIYPWATNLRRIIEGTPSWRDIVVLGLDEPLAEIGQRIPEFGIAEWNLTILPHKLTIVGATALLGLLYLDRTRHGCRAKGAVMVGTGTLLTAIASATVGWVACCATPSWAVVLAMFGLWASTALALEPYGTALTILGLALISLALVIQARAATAGSTP